MFGIFGKKEAPNESFNNLLLSSLGEMARTKNRYPSTDELVASVSALAGKHGYKLTAKQDNSVRLCAGILQLSPGDEIFELAGKMTTEIAQGNMHSADLLRDLLSSRGVIISDEALNFMDSILKKK